MGALIGHLTGGHLDSGARSFQPMNINYGLLPPMEAPRVGDDGARIPTKERGRAKKRVMGARALADLEAWRAVWPPAGPDAPTREAALRPAAAI